MGKIKFGKRSDLDVFQDFVDVTKYNLEDISTTPLREAVEDTTLTVDDSVWEKGWEDYPDLVEYTAEEAGVDLSKVNDHKQ